MKKIMIRNVILGLILSIVSIPLCAMGIANESKIDINYTPIASNIEASESFWIGEKEFLRVESRLSFECFKSSQTFSHAFRVEGIVDEQHVCFDIFGSMHVMPFKYYHPYVQEFLLNKHTSMITESNLGGPYLTLSRADILLLGACSQDPNPIFEGLKIGDDLEMLRTACSQLDKHLKSVGFKGIENLTAGFFSIAYSALFWGGESEIATKMGLSLSDVSALENSNQIVSNLLGQITKELTPIFEEEKLNGNLIKYIIDQIFSTELGEKYLNPSKEFFDKMNDNKCIFLDNERNLEWFSKLMNFIKINNNSLVVVGTSHLFGSPAGLLALFKEKNLSVQFLDLKTNEWRDYIEWF